MKEAWVQRKPYIYSDLNHNFAIQTVETHDTRLWYQFMDLDAETAARSQRSMCILAIEKLHGSLCLLSILWDGIIPNPRALLSYIDKSQRVTLTKNFFANKLAFTNHIRSLISGIKSSLTLSGIVFSVSICSTWSDVGPVACGPHDFLQFWF